jgi:hypothetical protein
VWESFQTNLQASHHSLGTRYTAIGCCHLHRSDSRVCRAKIPRASLTQRHMESLTGCFFLGVALFAFSLLLTLCLPLSALRCLGKRSNRPNYLRPEFFMFETQVWSSGCTKNYRLCCSGRSHTTQKKYW